MRDLWSDHQKQPKKFQRKGHFSGAFFSASMIDTFFYQTTYLPTYLHLSPSFGVNYSKPQKILPTAATIPLTIHLQPTDPIPSVGRFKLPGAGLLAKPKCYHNGTTQSRVFALSSRPPPLFSPTGDNISFIALTL